jgi:hypothetical protein
MDTIKIYGRIALTICIAIASMYTNADQRVERTADASWLQWLAMGPDPGGKSGAGVTPQTTRTDHPAAGPEDARERRTEPKTPADDGRNSRNAPRNDGGHSSTERASPNPSSKQ